MKNNSNILLSLLYDVSYAMQCVKLVTCYVMIYWPVLGYVCFNNIVHMIDSCSIC